MTERISAEDCSKMRSMYYDKRYSSDQISNSFGCPPEDARQHLRYECNHTKGADSEITKLREKLNEIYENEEVDEYETTTTTRGMPSEFRTLILKLYHGECLLTSISKPQLLDVAHVLPWSDYPEHRHDPENVMVLNKLHHAAFDSSMFTLNREYEIRLSPEFEAESEFLYNTLKEREGEVVEFPEHAKINPSFLKRRNAELDW